MEKIDAWTQVVHVELVCSHSGLYDGLTDRRNNRKNRFLVEVYSFYCWVRENPETRTCRKMICGAGGGQ
ncbi:MAG: hypothetical protein LW707_08155 [Sphingobacteriales bacterium]|nr:hypothetical protein [Sphingobacteriales bacterium]